MNPTNQYPIDAWLSNVQEDEPVDHWPPSPSPGIALPELSNELTTPYRMRLCSVQRGSNSRARVYKSSISQGGQNTEKPRRQDYGLKPRHKTREDRYEYKAPTSAAKRASETERPRTKRQRRGRKHTLNDDFQAANVVHSRLTLHQVPNMGFFNKGKTSSPVNLRSALGTMTFSETNFLAPGKDHGTKTMRSDRSMQGKEKGNAIQDACSGNLHTGLDSASHSTQGSALQDHLLNVLRRGLDISGVKEQNPLLHASRGYLDLDHLKEIMEERQRNWKPTSSQDGPRARGQMVPSKSRLSSIRSCETVSTWVFRAERTNQTNVTPGEASGADQTDYIDTRQIRGVEGEHNLPEPRFAIDTHRDVQKGPQNPQDCKQGPERILNSTKERYFSWRVLDTFGDLAVNVDRPSGSPHLTYSHRGEIGDLRSSSFSRFSNPPLRAEVADLILNNADEAFSHTLDMAYAMVNSEHTDHGVSRRDLGVSDTLPQAQDLARYDPPEAALLGLLDTSRTGQVALMNLGYSTLLSPYDHVKYAIEPDEANRLHGQVPLDYGGHEEVVRTSWRWRRNQLY
ncbi:hypothetical protein N7510_000483 [Penicillium lagena]|uniref:uncharacterized protein n=1 Tax=Penicillium lagena TaxID=94218 RepID=UPI00253F7189|nr:uncharacterized protein N7510_000483 [Penicillium lagena]KAJ5624174.1 hypothetical protein N7510_000483 [Penicillium lagena]